MTHKLRVVLLERGRSKNVVGVDVGHAVMHAVLLERACATQLTAMAAGELKAWTSDEEALEKAALVWSDSQIDAGWQYWVRRLDGK